MSNSRLRRVGAAVRRRWVPIAAGGVAVVLVGGGAGAAFAASSTPAVSTVAATTSTTACAPTVHRLLAELPASLKTDIATLRKEPASQKAAERAVIKKKALAGDYGTKIEQAAKIVAGDGGKLVSAIPASMKADLKTLRADPKGSAARKAEAAVIWKKSLAGSYGPTVENLAKEAQPKLKTCTPSSSATTAN